MKILEKRIHNRNQSFHTIGRMSYIKATGIDN